MARDWETTFRRWMGAASDTEKAKREHAESAVRDALSSDPVLAKRTLLVRAQGSYRNNTNVPQDSDVDIYVCCGDVCYADFDFAGGYDGKTVGLTDASLKYADFKAEVEKALVARFGRAGVARGSKAFDVHANSYRIDADVVATFEHRRYLPIAGGAHPYETGTEFRPDTGGRIINWPEQQYTIGVAKNKETGGRFKGVTRILKELRYEMADAGIAAASPIPSYLIECLVYHASNPCFGHPAVYTDVREVVRELWGATRGDATCDQWGEVNERKYLFRSSQPWTREQANGFLLAAWGYAEFK